MEEPLPEAARRVLALARRLFLIRPQDLRSVVQGADRISFRSWAEGVRAFPQAAVENEKAAATTGGEPVRDAFFLLTAISPRLVETPPEGARLLHHLLAEALPTPGFARLREACSSDPLVAAYGASQWVQELLSAMPQGLREAMQEAAAAAQEGQAAQEQAQLLQEMLAALAEEGKQPPPELVQATEEAAAAAGEAAARHRRAEALALAALRERAAEARAHLSRAAEAAAAHARETEAAIRGFDLSAGGEGAISPEAARAWLELLQRMPHLRELARQLGWARRTVSGLWRTSPTGRTQLVGYRPRELDPEHMAPWEMALMAAGGPAQADFLRRAAEGDVRHREMRGKEKMGRGPLVVVRDESGSMHGLPHTLAVAIEWALLEICRREGRPFVSICFSGPGQMRAWRAPEKPDHRGLLSHLSHFYGGGTEPYQAIAAALAEAEQAQEMGRADVLLISDACFAPPPPQVVEQVKAARRRRPLHIAAVLVGTSPGPLEQLASPIVRVQDLLAERDSLREAMGAVM